MKKIKKIFLFSFIGLVALALIFIGVVFTVFYKFGWKAENRIMLQEYISPDHKAKIGVYYYDIGAIGYSIINISLIKYDQEYPIDANLFKYELKVDSVQWLSNSKVLITALEDINNPNVLKDVPAVVNIDPYLVFIRIIPICNNTPPNQALKLTE